MGTAVPAFGTTFTKGTVVAGVVGISLGGVSISEIDSSDLADAWNTYTGGEGEAGTIELTLNVSEAQIDALLPVPGSAPTAMEIEYTGALGKFTFSGFIQNWSSDAQRGSAVTGTATIRVSGALTYVDAA